MRSIALSVLLCVAGCAKAPPSPTPDVASAAPKSASVSEAKDAKKASVGAPAPAFTLPDLSGAQVSLASFKGKTVVLEWFNPECPFVKAAHGKGSLRDFAKKATAGGAVWLAINSGAPGKQGNAVDVNRAAVDKWALSHPVLRDEDGAIGKAYGATNTPQMVVIDPEGTIVYRGAIDNSPDGEGESPTGGKLVNHVEAALADLAAKRPVAVKETRAYGCSVKYASK